ncbi:MAG: hydrogenase/urease maturation nickel metallochaperone HypA [Chloroflexota bacterium]
MHETGLAKSLIHEVERVQKLYGGSNIQSVRVRMGALCPFSEGHLQEHYHHESKGTVAEHAHLFIEHSTDITDPLAQVVVLLSIEVEDVASLELAGSAHST